MSSIMPRVSELEDTLRFVSGRRSTVPKRLHYTLVKSLILNGSSAINQARRSSER
jgi:hypothetical protein